jgi:excisionase family DNA binding protein
MKVGGRNLGAFPFMKREIERLLTYSELAEKTGLTVRTLASLKYSGKLPYVDVGGNRMIRFRESAVADALRKLEVREI